MRAVARVGRWLDRSFVDAPAEDLEARQTVDDTGHLRRDLAVGARVRGLALELVPGVIGGEARQTELVAEEPTPAREVDRRRSAFTLCAVEYLPHRPQVRDDHARMRIH